MRAAIMRDTIVRVERGTANVTKKPRTQVKQVARPETTYLVTNMLRAVMNGA